MAAVVSYIYDGVQPLYVRTWCMCTKLPAGGEEWSERLYGDRVGAVEMETLKNHPQQLDPTF